MAVVHRTFIFQQQSDHDASIMLQKIFAGHTCPAYGYCYLSHRDVFKSTCYRFLAAHRAHGTGRAVPSHTLKASWGPTMPPPLRIGQSAHVARHPLSATAAWRSAPAKQQRKRRARSAGHPVRKSARNEQQARLTHHVPEPETTFNLLLRVFDTGESLLANIESHLLDLADTFSVGVSDAFKTIDVRESVQVHLSKHAKSGIDLALERQREIDVQQVFSRLASVMSDEHVQRRDLEKCAQGPREGPDERVEHKKLS